MKKFIFISLVIYQFAFITSNSIFDYSHEKGDSLNILAGALSSYRAIIPFGYNKLNLILFMKNIELNNLKHK